MKNHIVIIEDDIPLMTAMCRILEEEGYRVTSFTTLNSVDELASLNASLFIIDEQLPSVSGHIICIMLHSNPKTRHTPQLLISAGPLLAMVAALGEVDAALEKPFDLADLLATVAGLLKE